MNISPGRLSRVRAARRLFFEMRGRFDLAPALAARFGNHPAGPPSLQNHKFPLKTAGRAVSGGPGGWFLNGLLAVTCLAAPLMGGCTVAEPPADLVLINGPDPQSLDPALATSIEDLRVAGALFEGLTRYDPGTSRPIAGLADRWEISPDGRVYTFHLRDKLFWSAGQPITAGDVVYSWLRALDPRSASEYAGQLYYVKNGQAYNEGKITDPSMVGVHAPDAQTVRVELNDPTAFFLDLCAFQTLAVAPRALIEKRGEDWLRARPLPTSGPYRLDFWQLNYKIRLVKNPFYWDAANTKSRVIDCLSVTTPNTALNLYQTGQADVIWDQDLVPNELLDVLKSRPDYHTFHYLGSYFVRFNVTKPPFNDVRVRKALALVIDKQRLVTKILHGGGVVADHLAPDGVANYESAEGLGYDPDLARRLLAEAGYPGGKGFPSFEYLFDASSGVGNIHAQIGVELQQMWRRQLGVGVELKPMEKKVYLAAQVRLDYDASRSTWIGDYNDPNTFLDLFRSDNGNNRTGWKNARYDGLMHEANMQTDLKRRAALLREAETILVRDELPIVPLYFYAGFNYFNPEVIHGIYPNILDYHPLNAIWKGREVDEGKTSKSRKTSNFSSLLIRPQD
jgi:oligopeptide transport system substrate-binding protein